MSAFSQPSRVGWIPCPNAHRLRGRDSRIGAKLAALTRDPASRPPSELALLGFGELGATLAPALATRARVRAWSRTLDERRIVAAGGHPARSLADAVTDADAVLSAVPAGAASEVARAALALLRPGALYADLSSAPPEQKAGDARAAAERGVLYADAAVLGTVVVSGARVPIVAAGPGASALKALEPLAVELLDGPAGRAARLKLLRSVYLKGRDALIVETLLAARRHALEAELVASIGAEVGFGELSERVLRGLAMHASRRAEELAAAAGEVRSSAVEPLLAEAGAERLRRVAALGLRERPERGSALLDALDEAGAR